MSHRLLPRTLAACLLGTVVLAACTSSPAPGATPSPTVVDAAAVNDAMAAVADARQAAAEQVDAELRAAVRVESMAMGLRSPSTVDTTLEEVPAVAALVEQTDPAHGVAALDRLDASLEAARDAVGATLAEVDRGSWQQDFLTAQRDVLDALATWGEASRDVHRVVDDNWELWQQVVAGAAALEENRWRYRTEEEAAGTWEIEVDDHLDPLADASAALAAATDARDDAATAVTAADQHAAEVFADRPTEQPSTSP